MPDGINTLRPARPARFLNECSPGPGRSPSPPARVLGLGSGAVPQSSHVDERVIPAAFQGEWNERVENCGTGNNESRPRISASEVRFYESGGRVRGAFLHGPYELILVLDKSGEGQMRMATIVTL